MMDQLVAQISQRTGLSPETSQEVVNVVLSHLKERLPEPIANGLNSFLTGAPSGGGESLIEEAKSAAASLSGLLGNKA